MQNIMLTANAKQIKIVDLGFGNWYDPANKLRTNCGSPEYAAPELYQTSRGHGPPVDLWSLGVVIYAMVTGYLPFAVADTSITSTEKRERLLKQIEKGFQLQHKAELSCVSQDCVHVVSRLLTVADQDRIAMQELMFHPWVTCRQTRILKDCSYKKLETGNYYRIVKKITQLLNMTQDDVMSALKSSRTGTAGGMFNILLLKQFCNDSVENISQHAASRNTNIQHMAASNAVKKRTGTRSTSAYCRAVGSVPSSACLPIQSKPRAVSHCKRVHLKPKFSPRDDSKRRVGTPALLVKQMKIRASSPNTCEGYSSSSSSFDSIENDSTFFSSSDDIKHMAFRRVGYKQENGLTLRSKTARSSLLNRQKQLPVAVNGTEAKTTQPSPSSNAIDQRPSAYFSSTLDQKPRAKTGISKPPLKHTYSQERSRDKLADDDISKVPSHARFTLSHLNKRSPQIRNTISSSNQKPSPKRGSSIIQERRIEKEVVPTNRKNKASPLLQMSKNATETGACPRETNRSRPKMGVCTSLVKKIHVKGPSVNTLNKSPRAALFANSTRQTPHNKLRPLSTLVNKVRDHFSDHQEETVTLHEDDSLKHSSHKHKYNIKSTSGYNSHGLKESRPNNLVETSQGKQLRMRLTHIKPIMPHDDHTKNPKRAIPLVRGTQLLSPYAITKVRNEYPLHKALSPVRVKQLSFQTKPYGQASLRDRADDVRPRRKNCFSATTENQAGSRGLSGVRSRTVKTTQYTNTPVCQCPERCETSPNEKCVAIAHGMYAIGGDPQTIIRVKSSVTVSKHNRPNTFKNNVSKKLFRTAHSAAVNRCGQRPTADSKARAECIPRTMIGLKKCQMQYSAEGGKGEFPHGKRWNKATRHNTWSYSKTIAPSSEAEHSSPDIETLTKEAYTPSKSARSSRSVHTKVAVQRSSPNTLSPRYNCKCHNVVFKPSSSTIKATGNGVQQYERNMILTEHLANAERSRRSNPSIRNVRQDSPEPRTAKKVSSYFSSTPKPSMVSSGSCSRTASRHRGSVRIAWAEPSSPDRPHFVGLTTVQEQHDSRHSMG